MRIHNYTKRVRAAAVAKCVVCAAVAVLGLGHEARADFTLEDFEVLNNQANPNDPHEVFWPDFNTFTLKITGSFDVTKCYRVKVDHYAHPVRSAWCGSRSGSGNYQASEVTADYIIVTIAEGSASNFKNGLWTILVKENQAPGCTGTSLDKIHDIYLSIAGCNDYCLLEGSVLNADPAMVECGQTTDLCVGVTSSSGNLRYEWDLDGDGEYDDLTTELAFDGNCITQTFSQTTLVGVRVVDQGTFVEDCYEEVSTLVTFTDCDDGLWCNGMETCVAGTCQPGTPPDCSDGLECTVDSCDEENDLCVNTPDDTICDDGLWCNGAETCDVELGCVNGTPPDCSDPQECTADSCDEENDVCVNTPDNTVCDDGIECTVDSCDVELGCVNEPDDGFCDDGDVCTIDTCDPDSGCQNVFDDTDADGDGIPDCISCPPLDVVFVMDTSGTMTDEAEILCGNIDKVVANLAAAGVELNATIWGITQTPGGAFSCLTDTVAGALGTDVPGNPPCCPSLESNEDWGLAVAIVAEGFGWLPDAIRVIVPLADEGPLDGDPCEDPGADRDAITHAIDVARANGVLVTPITGDGSNACVIALAEELAAETGGDIFKSTEPAADVASAIEDAVVEICLEVGPGGIGDGDGCPLNPDKAEPGVCGCSLPDVDRDADGTLDCLADGEPAPQPPPADATCGACGAAGAGLYSLVGAAYAMLLCVRRRRR